MEVEELRCYGVAFALDAEECVLENAAQCKGSAEGGRDRNQRLQHTSSDTGNCEHRCLQYVPLSHPCAGPVIFHQLSKHMRQTKVLFIPSSQTTKNISAKPRKFAAASRASYCRYWMP